MFACSLQRNYVQFAAMIFVKTWFSWDNCLLTADKLCSICRNYLSRDAMFLGCVLARCREMPLSFAELFFPTMWFSWNVCLFVAKKLVQLAAIIFVKKWFSWGKCLLTADNSCSICRNILSRDAMFLGCLLARCKEMSLHLQK